MSGLVSGTSCQLYRVSKTALKKELKGFSAEQLTEVILNVYDSSKEAKDYFEFFLNPDPEVFIKVKFEEIFKELKRVKRGSMSKGRISVIRKYIRQAQAYGLSPEYIDRLMMGAISLLVSTERYLYYSASLFNGTYKLVADYIIWADKHGILAGALEKLESLIHDSKIGTDHFRNNVASTVGHTVRNLNAVGK